MAWGQKERVWRRSK